MRFLVSLCFGAQPARGTLCRFLKIDARMAAAAAGEGLYQKIETFVFFDIETTDLIKATKMPQIIELSMIATGRNSLRFDKRNKLALPRIMHKLTIPIKPTQLINPQASYVCNLWNDNLEHVKSFDENTYDMIMQFIDRLPGLICFVSHNGNRFDYPVFLAELERLNKIFPDRILCIDTLTAFREFFSEAEAVTPQPMQYIPPGRDEVDEEELLANKSQEFDNSLLDDQWNDSLCSVLDNFDKVHTKDSAISSYENGTGTDVIDSIANKNQPLNSDYSGKVTPPPYNPAMMQAINEKTPENQIIRNSHISSGPQNVLQGICKKLNFSDGKPKNFKLPTIYLHMLGCEPENTHTAEDDCISMLRCCMQIGTHFAEWADCNAVSLNTFRRGKANK